MEVFTLAFKRSELIGNAAIVLKRRVVHKKSTCVCLRLPVAARNAETQERKVDLCRLNQHVIGVYRWIHRDSFVVSTI